MSSKIDFVAKIINIGNSIGMTIPKDVKDVLNLEKGHYVQLSIEKIKKEEIKEEQWIVISQEK